MILRPGSGDVQISPRPKLPVHALRPDSVRFSRSRREAHTGSRQLFAKVDFGLPRAKFSSRVDLDLEASRSFRPTPHTKFGVISCSRALSGPWHTGLGSGLS